MKKSKKHLSRLGAYLKKEGTRLEKLISRLSDAEDSALLKAVVAHLVARREVALSDLGLVDAAEKAMRKAEKPRRTKKTSAKKAPKQAAQKDAKAPRKSASKPASKAAGKTAAVKRPVRRRKVKAAAPPAA